MYLATGGQKIWLSEVKNGVDSSVRTLTSDHYGKIHAKIFT